MSNRVGTSGELYKSSSPALRKLLHRNVKCYLPSCWRHLYINQDRFNGCETNALFAETLHSFFSKPALGLVISIVEQPLASGSNAIQCRGTSPYGDRFQIILYKIYESGLTNIWHENEKEYLKFELRAIHDEYVQRKKKRLTKKSSNFYDSILMLLGIALSVCFTIFLLEIYWPYLRERIENYTYNLFFF